MKNAKEANKLHDLIHGLSTSDKAHLKKYSKIFVANGPTKYKVYYSALEKMEQYSLETLKKMLDKHGGYKRFKNTEQELYSQILEDLVLLKSMKHLTWQYYLEHMKSGYLFLDGKFEETLNHFNGLNKLKEECNNVSIDYMYNKFYYYTLSVVQDPRNTDDLKRHKQAELELRQSIENVRTEFLLEAAVHNFNIIRQTSFNKTKAEFLNDLVPFDNEYVDVLPKTLETERLKMLSVYYFFFCTYCILKSDYEQLEVHSRRFYEKLSQNDIKYRFSHEYVNAVSFRLQYFMLTKDRRAYDVLAEFKEYIERGDFYELKSFLHGMYCQRALAVYHAFHDGPSLQTIINKEISGYIEGNKSTGNSIVLIADLLWAFSFFKLKQYKKAQPFLDKIFDAVKGIKQTSNKVLITARVLDIMIHFELKNHENIPYYIDSLEKDMKRNGQLIPFDKQLFSHLRKLNQQLFAKQPLEKEPFIDFLRTNKNEDRVESFVQFLQIEHWLEGFN